MGILGHRVGSAIAALVAVALLILSLVPTQHFAWWSGHPETADRVYHRKAIHIALVPREAIGCDLRDDVQVCHPVPLGAHFWWLKLVELVLVLAVIVAALALAIASLRQSTLRNGFARLVLIALVASVLGCVYLFLHGPEQASGASVAVPPGLLGGLGLFGLGSVLAGYAAVTTLARRTLLWRPISELASAPDPGWQPPPAGTPAWPQAPAAGAPGAPWPPPLPPAATQPPPMWAAPSPGSMVPGVPGAPPLTGWHPPLTQTSPVPTMGAVASALGLPGRSQQPPPVVQAAQAASARVPLPGIPRHPVVPGGDFSGTETELAQTLPFQPVATPHPVPPATRVASPGENVVPACPQCQAPTSWVDAHLRFFCS